MSFSTNKNQERCFFKGITIERGLCFIRLDPYPHLFDNVLVRRRRRARYRLFVPHHHAVRTQYRWVYIGLSFSPAQLQLTHWQLNVLPPRVLLLVLGILLLLLLLLRLAVSPCPLPVSLLPLHFTLQLFFLVLFALLLVAAARLWHFWEGKLERRQFDCFLFACSSLWNGGRIVASKEVARYRCWTRASIGGIKGTDGKYSRGRVEGSWTNWVADRPREISFPSPIISDFEQRRWLPK